MVRSPINADFRATGRSTMGVKFVTPKDGDSVAVVARSVERAVEEAEDETADDATADAGSAEPGESAAGAIGDSADSGTDATIEGGPATAPEED